MSTKGDKKSFAKTILQIIIYLLFSQIAFSQNKNALETFLGRPELRHATVGFRAVDLSSGKVVAAFNDEAALPPASCMKLITTATALCLYGTDHVFLTRMLHDKAVENGTLKGNLYIKGDGDPTIRSEFFKTRTDPLQVAVEQLKADGIRRIEGDIEAIDDAFGYNGVSQKWLVEDIGNYYAPGIYGLGIYDNTVNIALRSSAAGSPVEIISTSPEIEGLTFSNDLQAVDSGDNEAFVLGLPFSSERRLYGTVPAWSSRFILKADVPDPGLLFAQTFRRCLVANGIAVNGDATTFRIQQKKAASEGNTYRLPSQLKSMKSIVSPTLSEIVRSTNVHSNNLFAEAIFRRMTIVDTNNIADFWAQRGLDTTALKMLDGSGLSPQNAVSARFLTDLLVSVDSRDDNVSAIFYNSLPAAGREGTVASFLKNTALAGKMRAKSGSISGVQSYSGFVETGGRRYAFSLIVSNFTCKRQQIRTLIAQFFLEFFS